MQHALTVPSDNSLDTYRHRDQLAVVAGLKAEPRLTTGELPLRGHVLEGSRGPLSDRLAFPLANAREHVEDQPARGTPRVNLLSDREKRYPFTAYAAA